MGDVHALEILLVEDNPGDAELFRQLMNGPCNISVAATGLEAFDRLFQRGRFSKSPLANLVVLDVNVPILTGFEILAILKGNSRLRAIPVVVWSGSTNERDIERAFNEGACAYIVKDSDLQTMEQALSAFAEFWIKQVLFPGVVRIPKAAGEGM
jgi:CheY-like chemotaxis protein